MFKLDLSPSYFAPVSLQLLDEDGVIRVHKFDARFRRFTEGELEKLQDDMRAGIVTDHDLLKPPSPTQPNGRGALVSWRGVADAAGAELPFSAEALDTALNVHGLRVALVKAFFASLDPVEGAALPSKN